MLFKANSVIQTEKEEMEKLFQLYKALSNSFLLNAVS